MGLLLTTAFLYSPAVLDAGRGTFDFPRPGEAYVSDVDFYECVDRLLQQGKVRSPSESVIPLMVIPVTLDYMDLKTLFCNITVPIKRLLIINTGRFEPLTELLTSLSATVKAPGQLSVSHYPENIGYSGAVNIGYRLALDLGHKEVPFVFVSNADVRFGPGALEDMIGMLRERTSSDAALIERLEEVVAEERNALQKNPGGKINVWTGHYDTGKVVTSKLLPSYVRKLPISEMRKTFAGRYALFFTHAKDDMCSFAVSYLALATVGLFDENYFPAYGEDPDYKFRIAALGFNMSMLEAGRDVHFSRGNVGYGAKFIPGDDMPGPGVRAAKTQVQRFLRVKRDRYRLDYRTKKWFYNNDKVDPDNSERELLPLRGVIPVDAWVKDTARIKSIRAISEGEACNCDYSPYNLALLQGVI